MKQVTRNIDPTLAYDLLRQVPRACLAFASEDGAQAQPVRLNWHDERYVVAIPQSAVPQPKADQEVVLLVDEGVFYFDLRAIYIRGTIQPLTPDEDAAAGYIRFEIIPSKILAWDYGMMREVDDAD